MCADIYHETAHAARAASERGPAEHRSESEVIELQNVRRGGMVYVVADDYAAVMHDAGEEQKCMVRKDLREEASAEEAAERAEERGEVG
jgi:hypothetical protein